MNGTELGGSTNPMQRRGDGGELVAPEATGTRRPRGGDGERRHGAMKRRHPSPSLSSLNPKPQSEKQRRITNALVRVPPDKRALPQFVGCFIDGP
jgi:hypothetical protein